jgi:hypothetical protein
MNKPHPSSSSSCSFLILVGSRCSVRQLEPVRSSNSAESLALHAKPERDRPHLIRRTLLCSSRLFFNARNRRHSNTSSATPASNCPDPRVARDPPSAALRSPSLLFNHEFRLQLAFINVRFPTLIIIEVDLLQHVFCVYFQLHL